MPGWIYSYICIPSKGQLLAVPSMHVQSGTNSPSHKLKSVTNCNKQGRTKNKRREMRYEWPQLDLKENVSFTIWPLKIISNYLYQLNLLTSCFPFNFPSFKPAVLNFFPILAVRVTLSMLAYYVCLQVSLPQASVHQNNKNVHQKLFCPRRQLFSLF